MNAEDYLNILYVLGAIAGIYLIVALFWRRAILKSTSMVNSQNDRVLGVYHLPETMLEITSKATVALKGEEGQLINQSFEIQKMIEPDTEVAYTVEYYANPFATEQIDYKINKDGLLESITSVSDSKVTKIIADLASFVQEDPTKMATESLRVMDVAQMADVPEEEVTVTATKVFKIRAWDVTKEGGYNVEWLMTEFEKEGKKINTEVKVEGGFNISALKNGVESKTKYANPKNAKGLLFRPFSSFDLKLNSGSLENEQSVNGVDILDKSLVFNVPIRSTPLVKREHNLEIENGILLSHKVVNPSLAEAFITIPINVGRALISIPTQLFRLRLDSISKSKQLIDKEVELEKSKIVQEVTLEKERLSAEKDRLQAEKEKLETEKELLTARKELLQLKLDSTLRANSGR